MKNNLASGILFGFLFVCFDLRFFLAFDVPVLSSVQGFITFR